MLKWYSDVVLCNSYLTISFQIQKLRWITGSARITLILGVKTTKCVIFTQIICKNNYCRYICVVFTQTIKNQFVDMNIMNYLGFSRKGSENKTVNNEENGIGKGKSNFRFSDKYAREKDETRIYNLIILDESGSMSSIREQALSGANETLQTIRTAQQENPDDHQMISFVTFDTGARHPFVRALIECERIEAVSDISPAQYQPYGGTPLYDAMGLSITALKDLVKEGDHVLVTVITDGFENSSNIYTAEMIKELVESLTNQGWVFTYIGANQDSKQTASGLGIRSTMDFQASIQGSVMMFDKMRSSNREYYKKVRRAKLTGEAIDYEEDFFAEKQALTRVTPERIVNLEEGQVFVFGSNLQGHHDGGAARVARERFGAIYGQGVGLQGQSYAIPTMNLPLGEISRYVDEFIWFADSHPEMTFMVTRIGCGIAGFRDEEIAPLFAKAYSLPNVFLPMSFWKILSYRY